MLDAMTLSGLAMGLLSALVAAGVTFAVRSGPRWGRVYQGIDTWFHLKLADVMRTQRGIPVRVEGFLVGDTYDYPPALSRLLSFLPRPFAERYQWAMSPATDVIHAVVIFAAAAWLWQNWAAGAVACAVYLAMPIPLSESSELSPRSAGALFVSITAIATIVFDRTGGWPWAACAMLAVAAAALTHRMSTQTLIFLLALMSLAMRSLAYIGVLGGGLLLAIVLSRGLYLRVLRGHLAELRFWRQHVLRRDDADPLKLLLGPRASRERAPLWRAGVTSAYGLIRNTPYICAVPIAYFSRWDTDKIAPLLWWAGIVYAAFLVTTYVRPLRFLGQGYRYLAHIALPVSAVAAGYVTQLRTAPWYVHAGMGLLAVIAIRETAAHWQRIHRGGAARISDDLWAMLDDVRGLPRDGIVCVPMALASPVAYFTGRSVLRHYSSQAMNRLSSFYPLVSAPLDDLAREFDGSYIILHEGCSRGSALSMSGAREIARHGPYHLYEVAATSAAAAEPHASHAAGDAGEGKARVTVDTQPKSVGRGRS